MTCAKCEGFLRVVVIGFLLLKARALKSTQWLQELELVKEAFPEYAANFCPNLPPYGGLRAMGEHVCQDIVIVDDPGPSTAAAAFDDQVTQLENIPVVDLPPSVEFSHIDVPVAVWWTGFTKERGKFVTCGAEEARCFFTANRRYREHERLQAFLFYGTDVRLHDLPLPRLPHHQWALLHEESPKNNWFFSSGGVLGLFNQTATFRRESDYPLTTMWLTSLADIESHRYNVPISEKNSLLATQQLGPIAYVQSDCDPPSDRDHLVRMLSRYIKIDSYGRCLHNKDLPTHIANGVHSMDHPDFYKLLAKYKFLIAMENAVCDDYITEKFWRAFYVGTIPIVYGSPTIRDFLPTPGSAVLVTDHDTLSSLVQAINFLNSDDAAYEAARGYKFTGVSNRLLLDTLAHRDWGSSRNPGSIEFNFISGFECFVCRQLHISSKQPEQLQPQRRSIAKADHYGCPGPWMFRDETNLTHRHVPSDFWHRQRYRDEMTKAAVFLDWYSRGMANFTEADLNAAVLRQMVASKQANKNRN